MPRARASGGGDVLTGGAAAEAASTAYGQEASDRYLSHRERMITATRERMGDGEESFRVIDLFTNFHD